MPSEVPAEIRQEIAKWRQIMYEPSSVWLSTENSGDRWLTDQYVLLNVTGAKALVRPDEPIYLDAANDPDSEWPDDSYKIMASGELRPRDSVPEPDLETYFAAVADSAQWKNATPTEWSVAEHPGKAMLWTCRGFPCLLGEPTWSQIKRHYPDVTVNYTFTHNLFRFSTIYHIDPDDDCAGGDCNCSPTPFAFAAGIRTPDGQQEIAKAVAERVAA